MPTFLEKVEIGSNSTSSVEQELQKVEAVADYYNLSELKENVSPSTEKSLISKVVSGEINPAFLKQILPIFGKIDPSILTAFASGKGARFLQLLSTLYTEQRLDLDVIGKLIDDPKVRETLDRVQIQYKNNGIAGVSTGDLLSLVNGINLSTFGESSEPMKRLLSTVIEKRTLSVEMLSDAFSSKNEVPLSEIPAKNEMPISETNEDLEDVEG